MSEDRTSQIINPETNSVALPNAQQHDAGLVDRTQQLIDEVNQLLGTGSAPAAPTAPINSESTAPVAEDEGIAESAAKLKSFLNSLDPDDSAKAVESVAASESESVVDVVDYQQAIDAATQEPVQPTHPAPENASPEIESESLSSVLEDSDATPSEAFVSEAAVESPELESEPLLELVEESDTDTSFDQDASEYSHVEQEDNLEAETLDLTQKYLNELRTSFDQKPEVQENTSQLDSSTATAEVESSFDSESESDSGAISVESWLASNVNDDSTGYDEVEPVVEKTTEAVEQPANNSSDLEEAKSVESLEIAEVFQNEMPPTTALENTAVEQSSPVAYEGDRQGDLYSLFKADLEILEARIDGMFTALSNQISQLAASGSVSQSADTVTDAENEAEETDSQQETQNTESPRSDADKIEALKEQLTSKLREAEIELSINRAKLSQQRASIEQMQADLERREAAVEAKLAQAKSATKSAAEKKGGLMDRWKRHLGE